MGELAKQNHDFAMMHGLRVMSESQTNKHKEWKEVDMTDRVMLDGIDGRLFYSHPKGNSALHLRVDAVLTQLHAQHFRDMWVAPWSDSSIFEKVFQDFNTRSRELPEFAVEEADLKMKAVHLREPDNSMFRDTVFLQGVGKTTLSKSTLTLSPDKSPMLALPLGMQLALAESGHVQSSSASVVSGKTSNSAAAAAEFANSTGAKKRVKFASSQPLECGTVDVFYGLRTVTGHGRVDEDEQTCTKRLVSTSIESIYVWNDQVESLDENLAGPGARMILILSLAPDFHLNAIGGVNDFVDANGKLGAKLWDIFSRYCVMAKIMQGIQGAVA